MIQYIYNSIYIYILYIYSIYYIPSLISLYPVAEPSAETDSDWSTETHQHAG